MKLITLISALLFCLTIFAQNSDSSSRRVGVMQIISRTHSYKSSTTSQFTGATSNYYNVSTDYIIMIDSKFWGYLDRKGKMLLPFYKNCDEAMMYLAKMRRQFIAGRICKISGAVLLIPSALLLLDSHDDNSKKGKGIVLISAAGALLITGFIEHMLYDKTVMRSVDAYNKCKNKTGFLEKLKSPIPGLCVLNTMNIYQPGIQLRWNLN